MYFSARLLLLGLLSVFLFRPLSLCAQNVVINEFMASNGRSIADEDGDYEDWIELYNAGSEPVNLAGWGLTDDLDDPFKWIFPDVTIEPDEFLLVFASGKDYRGAVTGAGLDWYTALETATAQQAAGIWLFDEEEGETAQDSSGSANHGIIHGAARMLDDELGSALRFIRAEQQYVEISNAPSLQTTNSMTISMWMKPASLPGWQTVWDKAYGGEGSITLESTGRLNYYWGVSGENAHPYHGVDSGVGLPIDKWTHVTMIRCLERRTIRWYFDGELHRTMHAEFAFAVASEAPLRIGRGYAGAFDGWIARPMLLPYAADRQLHANFRINSAGEPLQLTRPNGSIADFVGPVALPGDVSYGRSPDGADGWFYFEDATPHAPNETHPYSSILTIPPTFSRAGGGYTNEFELVLSHPDPDVTIVYTLDGSEPDITNTGSTSYVYKNQYREAAEDPVGPFLTNSYQSHIYSDAHPVAIYDRSAEPDKLSQISSTHHAAPQYIPSLPVRKAMVVRAKAVKDGFISAPSASVAHTYFVWPDGGGYSLPIVSLQIQENLLFGYEEGIYVAGADWDDYWAGHSVPPNNVRYYCNYWRRGRQWEYPVNVEIFDPAEGASIINQAAGFRIHGYSSRAREMKSMRLYARNYYSDRDLFEHGLFEDRIAYARNPSNTLYNRVLLRGSHWAHLSNDIVFQALMLPVYEGVARSRYVILYINGEYWGITAIRDQMTEDHLARHFDIHPNNLIMTYRHTITAGGAGDQEAFNEMVAFIQDNDMSDAHLFDLAADMLCMRSYADLLIINIFSANRQFEYGFWRARDPENEHFGDGKWRTYARDFDWATSTNNHMAIMANPPYSIFGPNHGGVKLFANLLESETFKNDFINRFADHLNTVFKTSHFHAVVDRFYNQLQPYLDEDEARWSRPTFAARRRTALRSWGSEQPVRQRQQIRDHFGLSHDVSITVDSSDASHGLVRVNTIVIDDNTPGLGVSPYPWSGDYFGDIPVRIAALPEEGFRFVEWVITPTGEPAYTNTEEVLTLLSSSDVTVAAQFEPIPFGEQEFLLHEWDFEDEADFLAPSFTVGGGVLEIELEEYTEIERNDPAQDFATHHLRVNDPLGAEVIFFVPTKGYEAIKLEYLTRRSGQGAGEQTLWYSTNGVDWIEWNTYPVFDAVPQERSFDFSGVAGVADNMDLAMRITFAQGAGGESGNNRFDDVRVFGVRVDPSNSPPEVAGTPDLQQVVEGGAPVPVNLAPFFSDPDDDPLIYSASSSNTNKVQVEVVDNELILAPVERGQAEIVMAANDGHYYPATTVFRVLVYPSAHALTNGAFTFTAWDPNLPDGTYPEHMLYLQSDQSDTALDTPLLYAYTLRPEDYHANDQNSIGYPYNNTGRTRINGLNDGGIAFINTGQNRDLGGALLAVDTTGLSNSWVRWLGGTVLPNSRIYALRLQYRVGLDGPFVDLLDDKGQPIEYVRNELAGHAEMMPMAALPEAALDKEYIQLLWRYYRVSGGSGPRAQLRLDDILVSPYGVEVASLPAHGGSVSGERLFAMEQSTELTAEPALYYRFLRWAGDVPPDQEESNPLELWLDAPLSVTARFSEDVTENTGTPHWWLAQYGLTNDSFEVEALKLHGANNLPAWKMHIADLDPTDPEAALPRLLVEREDEHWMFEIDSTSTGRSYAVQRATNLFDGGWITLTNAPGTGALWNQEAPGEPASPLYFRGRITVFDE